MDKRKSELSEAELDTLFSASDAEAPLPSGDLMARILADAEAEQGARSEPVARRGFLGTLREALGGWAGISGLAGAVATGLVIGVFPPDALSYYSSLLLGGDVIYSDYVPALSEVSFDG
ncbi:MAG: hypothetical protein AAGF13_04745 [Pseudomonadota bacterium]